MHVKSDRRSSGDEQAMQLQSKNWDCFGNGRLSNHSWECFLTVFACICISPLYVNAEAVKGRHQE